MSKREPLKNDSLDQIVKRLDAILAVLLRQVSDDHVSKWKKQDKGNIVNMLIETNLSNEEISRVTNLAYGSVANVRTKNKRKK